MWMMRKERIKDDLHCAFTCLLYFCQQLFRQGSQRWSVTWVTIMSRNLPDWKKVNKGKGEVIPALCKTGKGKWYVWLKGNRWTRRPASCEGLQATGRHERFLTEQRSDSWPWKKVTPAPVWRINWKGECLATSWLIEAVAQDQARPFQALTRTADQD